MCVVLDANWQSLGLAFHISQDQQLFIKTKFQNISSQWGHDGAEVRYAIESCQWVAIMLPSEKLCPTLQFFYFPKTSHYAWPYLLTKFKICSFKVLELVLWVSDIVFQKLSLCKAKGKIVSNAMQLCRKRCISVSNHPYHSNLPNFAFANFWPPKYTLISF